NFYLDEKYNEHLLTYLKPIFFQKLLKYISDNNKTKDNHVLELTDDPTINKNINNSKDLENSNIITTTSNDNNNISKEIKYENNETKTNIEKKKTTGKKKNNKSVTTKTSRTVYALMEEIKNCFVFNKKINVINSYRVNCFCSNMIDSLPTLSYFDTVKIHLSYYPLRAFLLCIYFSTFVMYLCDDNNIAGT
ncbi:E1-E2 ATPase, putative, partial [Hepatocystis sp. ex Piliocolobus tephrosceles]